MDVLQKEIDEVYATQLIADEILDNGVVEQHQRFIHSLTEINGGCAVISDLSDRILRCSSERKSVSTSPCSIWVILTFILGRIF